MKNWFTSLDKNKACPSLGSEVEKTSLWISMGQYLGFKFTLPTSLQKSNTKKLTYKWSWRKDTSVISGRSKYKSSPELWFLRGKGSGGGVSWEFGISRCKLVYIEWINNKILLYSPGNYIQYPVINHNGKENEKEYVYVCILYIYIYIFITEPLCCTAVTNTL